MAHGPELADLYFRAKVPVPCAGEGRNPRHSDQARGLTTVAVNSLKGKAPNSLNKQIINEF